MATFIGLLRRAGEAAKATSGFLKAANKAVRIATGKEYSLESALNKSYRLPGKYLAKKLASDTSPERTRLRMKKYLTAVNRLKKILGFATGQTFSFQALLNKSYSLNPFTNPIGFLDAFEKAVRSVARTYAIGVLSSDIGNYIGGALIQLGYFDAGPLERSAIIAEIVGDLKSDFEGFEYSNLSMKEMIKFINGRIDRGDDIQGIAIGLIRQGFYNLEYTDNDRVEKGMSDIGTGLVKGFMRQFGDYMRDIKTNILDVLTKFKEFLGMGKKEVKEKIFQTTEKYVASKRNLLRQMVADVIAKKMSVNDFESQFRTEIRRIQLGGMVIGAGGAANISLAHLSLFKELTAEQNSYFNAFLRDLMNFLDGGGGSGNKLISRAGQYADAARIMQRQSERQFMLNESYSEERRNTQKDESVCPGCVQHGDYWAAIGELPEIGTQDCGNQCRCVFEYRVTPSTSNPQSDDYVMNINEGDDTDS